LDLIQTTHQQIKLVGALTAFVVWCATNRSGFPRGDIENPALRLDALYWKRSYPNRGDHIRISYSRLL